MDVLMPRVNGLEATRQIMSSYPTPIVVVSAVNTSPAALDALQAGALAVIEKPPARNAPDYKNRCSEITQMLKLMANVRVIRHWPLDHDHPSTNNQSSTPITTAKNPPLASFSLSTGALPAVIGIGASAGGPGALATLLGSLPADFPLPILVVQHLSSDFVPGLTEWLDRVCNLNVRLAIAGEIPMAGTVYVAPGNRHLRFGADRRLVLDSMVGGYRHCPAVDALFESMATMYRSQSLGIILTGMGDDGAAGLGLIRDNGGHTIAQDEPSSVVFGMPAAAIARGAAEVILPLSEIGIALQHMVGYSSHSRHTQKN